MNIRYKSNKQRSHELALSQYICFDIVYYSSYTVAFFIEGIRCSRETDVKSLFAGEHRFHMLFLSHVLLSSPYS